jgi:hypothetical protein
LKSNSSILSLASRQMSGMTCEGVPEALLVTLHGALEGRAFETVDAAIADHGFRPSGAWITFYIIFTGYILHGHLASSQRVLADATPSPGKLLATPAEVFGAWGQWCALRLGDQMAGMKPLNLRVAA